MLKLIRTSTIPASLENLLKGQLKMLSKYYNVLAVSSPGDDMETIEEREGVRTIAIPMERRISLIKDFISLIRLIVLFAKERPDMVHSITPKAGYCLCWLLGLHGFPSVCIRLQDWYFLRLQGRCRSC